MSTIPITDTNMNGQSEKTISTSVDGSHLLNNINGNQLDKENIVETIEEKKYDQFQENNGNNRIKLLISNGVITSSDDNNNVCTVTLNKSQNLDNSNNNIHINNNDIGSFNVRRSSKVVMDECPCTRTNDSNDFVSMQKASDGKRSSIRHIVALLALSSIILANMNRQAFNVSMPNMIKIKLKPIIVNDETKHLTELSSSCPWPEKEKVQLTTVVGSPTNTSSETIVSESNLMQSNRSYIMDSTTSKKPSTALDKIVDDDDRFDWSGAQTGRLQSGFSWGYAPFMIFGGRLSELYGAKWIVLVSGLGSALCCLLTPLLADNHFYLLLASRVLMGLCQTGVSPALYALCARWLPPEESSIYLPLIKVGVMIGMFSGALISGFLSWRMTFYVTGLIGLVWSFIWIIYVTSDPSEHKMINQTELDYIIDKIQESNKGRKLSARSTRNQPAPWFNIVTNRVVIVFMMTKFTVKLATDTQSIELPMYLSNVFHVDKEINGLLTSINFGIQGLFTGLVAWMAKEMVYRKTFGLSKTGVRKLFQSICQFGCGSAFLLVSFNDCSITVVMAAIILTSIASMFGSGGEAIIPIDLSTDYPASIMALANSLANLSGVLLPLIAFNILGDDVNNKENWNYIWMLVGLISIGGGVLWLFFVEANLQDFSRPCLCCDSSSSHTRQNGRHEYDKEEESHFKKAKTSKNDSMVMTDLKKNDVTQTTIH